MDNAALILSENARLFRAAPDLLLECRSQRWAFQELLSGAWDGSEEGIRSSIRTLTNVIVKAAGRRRRSA
ncbi:MAG: hypothetical protein JNL96_27110 [Planctomycetaceae bacterium]|nr:hypothetical protein [Planctomycetaceae bacterium]